MNKLLKNIKKQKRVIILFLFSCIFLFSIELFGELYITGNKVKNTNPIHWDDFAEEIPSRIPHLIFFAACFTWILNRADKIK